MRLQKILAIIVTIASLTTGYSAAASANAWRIAMVQFDGDRDFGETEANAERLLDYIETAATHGAGLVVLPEGSLHGYATETEVWCRPGLAQYAGRNCRSIAGVAEVLPGSAMVQWFAGHADRLGLRIVYATIEKDGADYYNTVVLVGPDGYEAKYRKRVLYYLDQGYATSGSEETIVTLPIGPVGFMICADANYDNYFTSYKSAGVAHLILPTNWDQDPDSSRSAASFFASKARRHAMTILAADAAAWDGTGAYRPQTTQRQRTGLPDPGVGVEGVSYVDLPLSSVNGF